MKKLLLSIITLSSISFLSAQKVKFGAKASLNLSKFSISDPKINNFPDSKFLVGFNIGGFVEIPLSDKFTLQPELLYSAQGGKLESNDIFSSGSYNDKETLKTSYINIPLLAKYYATEKLFFVAGPQIGFLLNANRSATSIETRTSGGVTSSITYNYPEKDNKYFYNSIDFSLGLGGGYFFTENLFAEARYNIGLSNIHKQEDESNGRMLVKDELVVKSSSIQIAVGYRF
jgi:Outer membrane protein beta-barrel domain